MSKNQVTPVEKESPKLHIGHILEMEAFGSISEYPHITKAQVTTEMRKREVALDSLNREAMKVWRKQEKAGLTQAQVNEEFEKIRFTCASAKGCGIGEYYSLTVLGATVNPPRGI